MLAAYHAAADPVGAVPARMRWLNRSRRRLWAGLGPPPTPVTRGGGAGRRGPTAEVADGGCTGWTPGRPMIVPSTTRRPTLSHQRKRTGVRAFSTDVGPWPANHPRRCASPAEALWRYDQRQPPRTSVPKTRRQADHRHAPRDRRSGRRGGLRRGLQAGWRRPAHPRTRLAQAPHAQETGRKSRRRGIDPTGCSRRPGGVDCASTPPYALVASGTATG